MNLKRWIIYLLLCLFYAAGVFVDIVCAVKLLQWGRPALWCKIILAM